MGRSVRILIYVSCLLVIAAALVGCAGGEYVGSKVTGTYHTKDCIWAEEMKRENRVWFETAEEAEAAGYEPCANCLPSQ